MAKDTQAAAGGSNKETGRPEKAEAAQELNVTMDKRIDLIIAVVVILTGIFILIEARGIRRGLIPDPIGAKGLPNAAGIFLIIAGGIVVVLRILRWRMLPGNLVPAESPQQDEEGYPASALRSLSIMAASLVWVWLIIPLGFLIITPLYLAAVLLIAGEHAKKTVIGFSLGASVILWVTFSQVLKVILPMGPLTALFRSWGLVP